MKGYFKPAVLVLFVSTNYCFAQNEGLSNSIQYKSPNISNTLSIKVTSIAAHSNSLHVSTKSFIKEEEKQVPVLSKKEEPLLPKETSQQSKSELVTKTQSASGLAAAVPAAFKKEEPVSTQANSTQTNSEAKPSPQTQMGLTSYPKYFALLIGNSDYKFSNESLPNLTNPTRDAEKFYNVLLKYSFPKENIRMMKNASRSDIIDALEDLASKVTEKDNLLIFYAGHGIWDENLRVGYWLPSDAMPGKKASWFSNSNLKDYIAGIKSKHTLLVSDACFSGSIFRARAVSEPLSEVSIAKLYKYPSRKAMTSGNLNTTPDDSKFFEYLSKRLTENDRQFISAKEIFYNMFDAVVNNTNSIPQYGVIQETGDEGGDFIFIRKE